MTTAVKGLMILGVLTVGALPPALGFAAMYCSDLGAPYGRIIAGELRYEVTSGVDAHYTNSYWNHGDELSLGLGQVLGGSHASASVSVFGVAVATDNQTPGRCASLTFAHAIQRSAAGGDYWCPAGGAISTATNVVDACDAGVDETLYATGLVGVAQIPYQRYWRSTLSVIVAGVAVDTESGCARILNIDAGECSPN